MLLCALKNIYGSFGAKVLNIDKTYIGKEKFKSSCVSIMSRTTKIGGTISRVKQCFC